MDAGQYRPVRGEPDQHLGQRGGGVERGTCQDPGQYGVRGAERGQSGPGAGQPQEVGEPVLGTVPGQPSVPPRRVQLQDQGPGCEPREPPGQMPLEVVLHGVQIDAQAQPPRQTVPHPPRRAAGERGENTLESTQSWQILPVADRGPLGRGGNRVLDEHRPVRGVFGNRISAQRITTGQRITGQCRPPP